jgi:hypothetical protein
MTQLTPELLTTTLLAFLTSAIMTVAWILAVIREMKSKNTWWAIVCFSMVIFGLGFSAVYFQVLFGNLESRLAGELFLRPMVKWQSLSLVAVSLRFRKG